MSSLPGALQQALDSLLAPRRDAFVAGPDQAALDDALREALVGGKRFRPRLVAGVHDALDGHAGLAVEQIGAAVELLHTCFLVYDDVIDGDEVRRGRASILGRFRALALAAGATTEGADTYARAASVLVGDLALSHALRGVAVCEVDAATRGQLIDLFDAALRVSAVGELADVRLSLGLADPSLTEVLTMEVQKTAAYSFELPMQAGAVLAGAQSTVVEAVGDVGRSLGIAYQLLDDLEGVFGDPRDTGKSALGDLREGKRTPLIVHARRTPSWDRIRPYLGRPDLDAAAAVSVRRALEDGGSRAFVEDLADEHLRAAAELAVLVGLPTDLLREAVGVTDDRAAGAA